MGKVIKKVGAVTIDKDGVTVSKFTFNCTLDRPWEEYKRAALEWALEQIQEELSKLP